MAAREGGVGKQGSKVPGWTAAGEGRLADGKRQSLREESRGGHGNAVGKLHREYLTVSWRGSGGLTTPLHLIFQEMGSCINNKDAGIS